MIKKYNKVFVYLSLVFLVLALYRANYIYVPLIYRKDFLLVSFSFLFMGFIFDAVCWKNILNKSNTDINMLESLSSVGLSVFGKYIPGVIWSVVGRVTYIAGRNHSTVPTLSTISLKAQFLQLWTGIVLGLVGLLLLNNSIYSIWLYIPIVILLTLVTFTNTFNKPANYILKKRLKMNIIITDFHILEIFQILPYYLIQWLWWTISFTFFVSSLSHLSINFVVGLAFPLAGTFGILAIGIPGGVGIREGVLFLYLKLCGLSVADALTISVTSRLWFLLGEFFIFILGVVSNLFLKKSEKN